KTKESFFGYEKVIVFDNYWIGDSSIISIQNPITIELIAHDTIELIKHFNIKIFDLFGESLEGQIALCITSIIPLDLIQKKLIIITSSPHTKEETNFYQKKIKYLLKHSDKLDKIPKAKFELQIKKPFEILKSIKIPTLIIYNEEDDIFPIQDITLLNEKNYNTEIYKFSNARH
ncbi:23203_t:CDS:2, partial [Gigaspora margarita]